MQKRDVCAACTGFTAACVLLAVVRYLAEPTALIAALLVACGFTFMVALASYASSLMNRKVKQRRRSSAKRQAHAQRPPVAESGVAPRPAPARRLKEPVTA
jgi:uncharacterized membrane protein YkvA (DUF1232 family)